MAVIEEVDVEVTLTVGDNNGELILGAVARSRDASGQIVRQGNWDLTDRLTATQRTALNNLRESMKQRVKTLWEIP